MLSIIQAEQVKFGNTHTHINIHAHTHIEIFNNNNKRNQEFEREQEGIGGRVWRDEKKGRKINIV